MDEEVAKLAARFMRAKFWVVETTPTLSGPDPAAYVAEHLKYQIALEKRGVLFAAGPLLTTEDVMTGSGLIIVRGKDEAEVRAIVDADPMHSSGAREYTLRQWHAHEGRMVVTIDLSDSSSKLG